MFRSRFQRLNGEVVSCFLFCSPLQYRTIGKIESESFAKLKAPMQLSLTDLRVFLTVADLCNLTQAAKRCNFSLPAVSQRIQAIEEQVRCQLLLRSARGVRLTAAGEAFARHARAMLIEADAMGASLSAFAGGLQGHVTVLANTTAVTEIMPKVLARFLAAHPRVSVNLREQGNVDITRAVREGRADVGVVAGELDFSGLDSSHFATDRLMLVVSRGHHMARRAKVAFDEVIDEPLVALYEGSTIQGFLAQRVEAMGRQLALARVQVNTFEAICLMAEAGVGVGIAPASVARRSATALKIRVVPLADDWALRKRFVVTRDLAARPPYVHDLVHAIRGSCPAA